MQTFLPYPSFVESARVLDNKRLGKQRVEAYQILNTLLQGPWTCAQCKGNNVSNAGVDRYYCFDCWGVGKKTPWYSHPAVKMWEGYEATLAEYGLVICSDWINRGFKDTLAPKFRHYMFNNLVKGFPKWLGNEKFHASHRSNLLRKDPKHYGKFGWMEPNNLPYYWPIK